MRRTIHAHRLGKVRYADALALQERLVSARKAKRVGDVLLLLEHDPPVITMGRGANTAHVLFPKESLQARGIELFESGRGGDVTYHGPGQLVGYPIIDLAPDRQDVRRYVNALEITMIRTCGDFDITAHRIDGEKKLIGTWVGERKIGAVGVRISDWVTMHGFAINVTTNLGHFDLIVPCGIRDREVTSIELENGIAPAMREVEERVVHHFGDLFDADMRIVDGPPAVATET